MRKKLISIFFSMLLIFGIFTLSFAEFRKGPYLQNVTQDSIIISWQTFSATTGTVYYGIGGTDLTVTDPTVSIFMKCN